MPSPSPPLQLPQMSDLRAADSRTGPRNLVPKDLPRQNLLPQDRLIVALDFPSAGAAFALVERLGGQVRWFKVGLELYLADGNAVISELKRLGYSVFLDLKLHDIPNTVAGAIRSVSRLGVDLLTVHAAGGSAMLRAAAAAAAEAPQGPALLAVTVLTSMDSAELRETGVPAVPAQQVRQLAELAWEAGIGGLVCSPEEAGTLRAMLGPEVLLVTPGIRPAGTEAQDQKRMATPAAALASGASYLVVGRPITQAADPGEAAAAILREMGAALNAR